MVPRIRGERGWRAVEAVAEGSDGTTGEESLGSRGVARLRRNMERRLPGLVLRVRVGPGLQEEVDERKVPVLNLEPQRRVGAKSEDISSRNALFHDKPCPPDAPPAASRRPSCCHGGLRIPRHTRCADVGNANWPPKMKNVSRMAAPSSLFTASADEDY